MRTHAAIAGVGMTTSTSPGRQIHSKIELCREAATAALAHAGADRADVDAVVFGVIDGFEAINVSAKTISPYLGVRPEVPFYIVSTGGSTGGNVFNLAASLVRSGEATHVLAIGPNTFDGPTDLQGTINTATALVMEQPLGMGAPHNVAMFATTYLDRYGLDADIFDVVAAKQRESAAHNPYAHLREPMPAELAAGMVTTPIRFGHTCPVSSGAVALLLTPTHVAADLANPVVRVAAYGGASDGYLGGSRNDFSSFEVVGVLSERLYRQAGVAEPRDWVDVIEVFAPFAPMELILLEDLGVCGRGEAPALTRSGATRHGGDVPTNLSGGPSSTNAGVAGQIAPVGYVALQLMGQAAGLQAEPARRGIAHSSGGNFMQLHTLALLERS